MVKKLRREYYMWLVEKWNFWLIGGPLHRSVNWPSYGHYSCLTTNRLKYEVVIEALTLRDAPHVVVDTKPPIHLIQKNVNFLCRILQFVTCKLTLSAMKCSSMSLSVAGGNVTWLIHTYILSWTTSLTPKGNWPQNCRNLKIALFLLHDANFQSLTSSEVRSSS